MKEKIVKDAMHRWVERIRSPSEMAKDRELPLSAKDRVAAIKQAISTKLMALGWPDPGRTLEVSSDGSWSYLDGPAVPPISVSAGFAYIENATEPLSEAHMLSRAFFRAVCAENAIKSGDPEAIFYQGMALGSWLEMVETRHAHLRKADVGGRQIASGVRGNAEKTASSFKAIYGDKAQTEANDIHRRNPNLSWAAIRRTLSVTYNVSDGTIKNALTNPKKGG
ncbi:hypothetical protein OEZ71_04710 [Defluviimonas sp. WL0050]|uniref:Uncharacterized protein n=1 Tax=Albidovulum litorale TaxID=2984134 RepID=A0ABT2ZLI7_9RHOB|nr:hypothetical protein [Defluviimonas sp. WL0050]MCV2871591.1 hypothetical protein [Defluviimonas sp. WL0050]